MKTEIWKDVKEILQEVLPLAPAERQNYLNEPGVNAEIRREVESLLSFEEEAEGLMNLPAVKFSKDFFDEDEAENSLAGQNVGVYKIVREIGGGGMGAVYLAERTDGKFKQKVALKLLKREMNTNALRRRFQQEREILASLEHPNVARLLDAGTTADKIPFLAMEYVEGLPIDEYCRQNNLNLGQRLDLFRQVCAAVNFAHRNLIVHRDLKPSNILVSGEGLPKLLDFGISKILSAEYEQSNAATVTKIGAMTPGYASPEQLGGKSVTTATDIYSLGIILYELLSGHRPFETKEDDLKEIYRAVLETEPPPPSRVQDSRFGIRDFDGKSVSISNQTKNQNHQTNPQSRILNPKSLAGDLDNIVLKALRKEPERRYSSAENFAEDIHRHQRGLPVTARPNTFSYRAEKFFKRNKASAAAGVLIVLAIVAGIAATLWQARVAQAERAKAEKRFGDVRKLANSYLFDVFPEIEDLAGSLKARQTILKTALEYLDSLSQETEGDAELQLELATAYEKIGEVQGAVNITNTGDINAGLASYKKAQKLREAVYSSGAVKPEVKDLLARNYQVIAQTLMWNVDTAGAADYFEKSIKIRRELIADDPSSLVFRNRLAVLLSDYATLAIFNVENEKSRRLLDESAAILKEILRTNPEHYLSQKAYPRILRADSRLKSNLGDYDGAFKDLDESVALTGEIIRQKPDDYAIKRTAWLNDFGYCEVYAAARNGKKIIESCSKTVDFNLKNLEKEPNEAFALYDLAISYYNIARGYRLSNDPHRAIEYAQKAAAIVSKLVQIAPDSNEYLRVSANLEKEIADAELKLDQPTAALENLSKAQTKMEKVTTSDPAVTTYQAELAKIYRSLAMANYAIGSKDKARDFVAKSIAIASKLKTRNNLTFAEKNMPEELETEKARFNE